MFYARQCTRASLGLEVSITKELHGNKRPLIANFLKICYGFKVFDILRNFNGLKVRSCLQTFSRFSDCLDKIDV